MSCFSNMPLVSIPRCLQRDFSSETFISVHGFSVVGGVDSVASKALAKSAFSNMPTVLMPFSLQRALNSDTFKLEQSINVIILSSSRAPASAYVV